MSISSDLICSGWGSNTTKFPARQIPTLSQLASLPTKRILVFNQELYIKLTYSPNYCIQFVLLLKFLADYFNKYEKI